MSAKLTPREREIVELLHRGLTNRQIANRLVIEVGTVKVHLHNIYDKTGVRRRTEVAAVVGEEVVA